MGLRELRELETKNGTAADGWGDQPLAGTMEKWGDRNLPITADLCDVNDAVKLVDLITWGRLTVSGPSVAI